MHIAKLSGKRPANNKHILFPQRSPGNPDVSGFSSRSFSVAYRSKTRDWHHHHQMFGPFRVRLLQGGQSQSLFRFEKIRYLSASNHSSKGIQAPGASSHPCRSKVRDPHGDCWKSLLLNRTNPHLQILVLMDHFKRKPDHLPNHHF